METWMSYEDENGNSIGQATLIKEIFGAFINQLDDPCNEIIKGYYDGLRKDNGGQDGKLALTSGNISAAINPKNSFVRESVKALYDKLQYNLNGVGGDPKIRMLYKEWDNATMEVYGGGGAASFFTKATAMIKETYGLGEDVDIDGKAFLFAVQTFYNMFLKLLVYYFLMSLPNPFLTVEEIGEMQPGKIFTGEYVKSNFFEPHCLEWFIHINPKNNPDTETIHKMLSIIGRLDMATYIFKPEETQDVFLAPYMGLLPEGMRHLAGWRMHTGGEAERALDRAGYDGDLGKTLVDRSPGFAVNLPYAIKRVVLKAGRRLSMEDARKVMRHVVGYGADPIAVTIARANYIIALFSACDIIAFEGYDGPLDIPVHMAGARRA